MKKKEDDFWGGVIAIMAVIGSIFVFVGLLMGLGVIVEMCNPYVHKTFWTRDFIGASITISVLVYLLGKFCEWISRKLQE